ncbi:hypothetical protein BJ741DRAFT_619216 [Chytriomyces cf. hyalinus JEL632]|nr:hypothetical protein BJ741DRAFT_619216 [Chytriomyces cf. hyalinus JEL632]
MAKALLLDPRIDPNTVGMALSNEGCVFYRVKSRNRYLLAAARGGHEDVVRLLLSEPRRGGDESAALFEAASAGRAHIISLRAKGSWQNSACLRQACKEGHLATVQLLLSNTDADINAYEIRTDPWDKGMSSPLYEAQKNGRMGVVEYLLKDPRLDLNCAANKNM